MKNKQKRSADLITAFGAQRDFRRTQRSTKQQTSHTFGCHYSVKINKQNKNKKSLHGAALCSSPRRRHPIFSSPWETRLDGSEAWWGAALSLQYKSKHGSLYSASSRRAARRRDYWPLRSPKTQPIPSSVLSWQFAALCLPFSVRPGDKSAASVSCVWLGSNC